MPVMYGTCPYCKQYVTNLDVSNVDAHVTASDSFPAVTFVCPHCHLVLGAGVDPSVLLGKIKQAIEAAR